MKTELLLSKETHRQLDGYLAQPSHAVLLSGRPGIGKTLLTNELAAALLHIDVQKIELTPYVRHVLPVDGKITVESIRSLASFVRFAVSADRKVSRVICIEDCESMTHQAQNALLKLLEEPPTKTVLILSTSQRRKLLRTIDSRLQHIQVKLPERTAVLAYLTAQGFAQLQAEKAWLRADGNMAKALGLLQSDPAADSVSVVDIVKRVLGADTFARLALIDTELKDKAQTAEFLQVLSVVASQSLSGSHAKKRWGQVLDATYTAQSSLQKNGNHKLVLTELMLSL